MRYSLGPYLTDYLPKQKGLIQGSPESSFIFPALINHVLSQLDASWRQHGFGIRFGKWHTSSEAWKEWAKNSKIHLSTSLEEIIVCVLAFVDDIYIIAKSFTGGQIMTNELVQGLAVIGLRPKISKAQWICGDHESTIERGDCLYVKGNPI